MLWISVVLTAVLAAAVYYGMLCIGNEKLCLNLRQREGWVTDTIALLTGGITLAGTGALSYVRFPELPLPQYLLTAAFLSGMAFLAVVDMKRQMIPNRVLAVLTVLWASVAGLYMILDMEKGFALLCRSLAGGLTGGIIFLLCYLVSRGQMGAGDVKLAFVMGLYLTGERIMGGILYGTLLCCIYSVTQISRKRLTIKDGVPMTPFLYLGVLITLFIN